MPVIRRAAAEDLELVAAIQQRSSGAAEWQVADYLAHEFLVAELEKQVVGFLVWRQVAADECEILNLAVVPEWRRKGVAKRLMEAALRGFQGDTFLEVRESNRAALALYKLLGFQEVSRRPGYYAEPPETGIVMKFHSC